MNNHLTTLINFFLPRVCILCKDKTTATINLCQACQEDLPWLNHQAVCTCCALPLYGLSEFQNNRICAECIISRPSHSRSFCTFSYQDQISWLLTGLKFQHKLHHIPILAHLMTQQLEKIYATDESLPECIIPVPLHTKRMQERGFNQALELAKPLAKHFSLPLALNSCQRIRATDSQSSLPAILRQRNIAGAFKILTIPAKHIVLVDDVMTTGTTLSELSNMFLAAGAERIDIWCCARTVLS